MERRIYVCLDTQQPEAKPRLVRASNPAQVRNHVSRSRFSVYVAKQDDLEKYGMKAHIEVEEAGEDSAPADGGDKPPQ